MGLWDWLTGGSKPEPAAAVPAPPGPEDIRASLARVHAMLEDGKAPGLVRSRVARIDAAIQATLPRLAQLGLGSADAYSVVATATDYLPEALGGYLRLPREWADSRPIEGGRTALMILIDQLELLAATMDKILDAANRADAQALIAHGQFLEAKFGHSSTGGQLEIGMPPGPGPLSPPAPATLPSQRPASGNILDVS